MILILPHALHTPSKWPGFIERATEKSLPAWAVYRTFDGTVVLDANFKAEKDMFYLYIAASCTICFPPTAKV